MAFPDDLEWNQPGVEPTQAKKDEGWKPEEKPPAEYFNWFFNRTSQAVKYLKGESDKLIDDAKIGNRTITDTVTAAAGAGTLTNLLSKLGNMIKRITGKSNWYTAPAISLEEVSNHTTATSAAHAASAISSTATGDVAATNVQAAITELASKKAALNKVMNKVGEPTGRDFNNFTTPDTYVHIDTGSTSEWFNTPYGTLAAGNTKVFTLRNIGLSNVRLNQYCDFYFGSSTGETWIRSLVGAVWSAWKRIPTIDLVLPLTGGNMSGAVNETMVTMASASTMAIGAAAGNLINVTGTTTITSLDTVQAGVKRTLRFASPLTITHNALSLILPGNVNITVGAGDVMEFASFGGGNWRCTNYHTNGGYAPAGYGLGTTANNYTGDIDKTAWETGFYYVRITATGTKPYDYGHMIVMVESAAATIKQIWLTNVTNDMQIRQCVNGVWSPWKKIATTDNYYDKATSDANYLPRGTTVATGDWNNYVNNGYCLGNNLANSPTSNSTHWYWVAVIRYADNYTYQQAHGFGGASLVSWERTQNDRVWSPWKKIATAGQIPIMTALVDWSTMATKAGVSSVKNLNNTGSGISAYGGDSGNLGNGNIYLKQSYKNFDAILVVGSNDNADFLMTCKWEKWELEFMFNQQYRFNLFNAGSYAAYWNVWCSKLAGTSHPQSTETVWYNQSQNGGIVEIYGLNY
ncbi:pyocin knob domain-containing protein [Pelosinus baikalensis]|uniref:Pyocin knob domain-containing protein n=1 Tax=Pelosinus baikalensis TaxID=2892015 RepID=A0ABS8I1X5_9FIRM|nr:pyocin knob domain-containing protein [Pelosinus baikalensis]MCC5468624.1 pyocin knob domain-containing protein [Pelosinus baikalensis]